MTGQIPHDVKLARAETVMLAQQAIAFEKNRSMVGSEVEILVDGVTDEGYCIGRYYGQAPDIDGVCILAEPRDAGKLICGVVGDTQDYDLVVEPQ